MLDGGPAAGQLGEGVPPRRGKLPGVDGHTYVARVDSLEEPVPPVVEAERGQEVEPQHRSDATLGRDLPDRVPAVGHRVDARLVSGAGRT